MGAAMLEPGRMDRGLAYFFGVFPGVAFFLRQRAEGEALGEGPVGIPGAILPSSRTLQRSREPSADMGVPGWKGDAPLPPGDLRGSRDRQGTQGEVLLPCGASTGKPRLETLVAAMSGRD